MEGESQSLSVGGWIGGGGQVFEDKREGVGMMTAADGRFYLGPWTLGMRQGRGFEGNARMTG